MATVIEELDALHKKLKGFPDEAHWFCPKRFDEDTLNYGEPDLGEDDVSAETKKWYIAEGRKREQIAYRFALVFGMDAGDSVNAQEWLSHYTNHLTKFLTRCDKCVRNYHLGRKDFSRELSEDLDDDTITELLTRIEKFDFDRIDSGLLRAERLLSSLPEVQRNMRSLTDDPVALSGLYEALCCEAYHKSPAKIFQPLGDVMKLIQTTRVLKISDVVPAMTRFLFDSDYDRHQFATVGWQRSAIIADSKIFDWVIHDSLTDAIQIVSTPTVTLPEVEKFWAGTLLILQKITPDLVTHSLRAMEVQPDLYHLALQHLSCNSDQILDNIIQVLSLLLKKSRNAFWEAFGTISPATVAEQIFNSPAFERLLARSHNEDSPDDVHIPDAISWVTHFIEALDSNHQYDACRFVLFNLLTRFQTNQIPHDSRLACCHAGLKALLATLMTFTAADYSFRTSTAFIYINNLLGLVDKYKDTIVNCATLSSNDKDHTELAKISLQVVRHSLSLDCKARNAEHQFLESNQSVNHGLDSHSQSIWQSVLDSFRPNYIEMAKSILAGVTPLVGLEKFRLNNDTTLLKDKSRFNDDFGQLMDVIANLLERLSDFTPENLRILCKSPSTAHPLIATLSSPHEPTYEAAVEIVKTMTGQETRRDAFSALLGEFLETSLMAIAFAAKRIVQSKGFAAVPRALKTGKDVLESLSDAQNGLLRISSSRSIREREAIRAWWTEQWRVIETSFGLTEKWSKVYDNVVVTNFCRDAMDYAEALFDQNTLFATVLNSSNQEEPYDKPGPENKSQGRFEVLEQPKKAVGMMAKWLRLKDAYLLSTIVSLLSKLLRRLGEFSMEIDVQAARYIEACAKATDKEGIRTYLTLQQKAELIKALEEHQGLELVDEHAVPNALGLKKQSTIDAWSRSAGGIKHEPSVPSGVKNQKEMIDSSRWKNSTQSSQYDLGDDVLALSSSIEKQRSSLEQMRSRQQLTASSLRKDLGSKIGENLKLSREREKEEKRQRDAAAVAKAKALRTGGLAQGEGSALKGLGVLGKDHAPLKGEIMVSSDEESSEDDSEVSTLIVKSKDASKRVLEYEERKRALKQLPPQGPVRKTKIIRSAKDMRARLVPDMSTLHLNILSWNIFHESDEPPSATTCSKVSDTFQTHIDYRDTFYPLLISEAWRSFRTAKEESSSRPFPIKVINRMSVDQFYEVSTTMLIAENRDVNLLEGDIVLLSKSDNPLKDSSSPHCLARIFRITRKKDVLEVSYRVNGAAANGRVNGTNGNDTALLPSLAPNVTIRGYKITSMTTIEREYAALNSLQYYDLCEEILEARPSPLLPYSRPTLVPIQQNYGVNMGQAKAIWSAKENDAFTLIQGPPGSGKTKTIVAMVGALLTESFVAPGVAINRPQSLKPLNETTKPLQKKLLVCAPSNAAVDELVMRLKEGVKTLKGETQKINVIRLGRSDAINASVKDVTLDELVRLKLEGDLQNGKGIASERDKWHKEAGLIKEQLSVLRPQLDKALSDGDKALELRLQREIDNKKREQARLGAKIDADKDSGNTVARENEIKRRLFQQQILDSAHVLCSTLSGSGHEMFRNLNVEFETVIIDEAAQCIELSALIPLKYGCSKCILVGDPKQLPPTVLSSMAARYGYEQSLFVRMQQNHPESVHLLDTQYRMHPEISLFPSRQFYDAKLVDGEGMAKLREKPWHSSSLLGPYRFFDVKGTQTTGSRGHSYINTEEISVAMQLYERLRADYKSYDFRGKVGIITPYKAQLAELRGRFRGKYGEDIFDEVDFNTTDAFQGRESEIIIFSCVRARATGGIGFLDDIRRMNVGLTRAKSSLWVLGDSQSLFQGSFWSKLIKDAQTRHLYTEGDILALLKKPSNRERANGSSNTPGIGVSKSNSLPVRGQDHRSQMPLQSSKLLKPEKNQHPVDTLGTVDVEMTDVPDEDNAIPNEATTESHRKERGPGSDKAVIEAAAGYGSSRLHEALVNESLARQKPTVQPTTHTPTDAEAFLKRHGSINNTSSGKRERSNSITEDSAPSKRKVPTGPRAATQPFNARPPQRRQDVAALSLLNSAAKGSTASNDLHNLATSTDGAGPQPVESSKTNETTQKPVIVRKRYNADPLRRNLPPNRPR